MSESLDPECMTALAEQGTVFLSPEPVIQFEDLRFPTPSGKIEIASEQAERNGHGRLPQPTVDARPSGGRFRLLSPSSEWTMNCSYANDPTIQRRLGHATVAINPRDAEAAGLEAGGRVRVHNEAGELALDQVGELADGVDLAELVGRQVDVQLALDHADHLQCAQRVEPELRDDLGFRERWIFPFRDLVRVLLNRGDDLRSTEPLGGVGHLDLRSRSPRGT